jgi:acetylornithine deacetylase
MQYNLGLIRRPIQGVDSSRRPHRRAVATATDLQLRYLSLGYSMKIDETFTADVLRRLVQINSVNPSLSPTGVGEAAIADYTAGAMAQLGLDVSRHEPAPGRVSVVGRLRGIGGGRTLMLNAHYDTVAVDEMADPFGAVISGGKCYGRGAYDMKGSLAACLAAVKALGDARVPLRGDVLVAAVADEEHASLGTSDLIGRYHVDGAIVTEPSGLKICLAHKGFIWMSVTVQGRAAHGSQFRQGVDANVRLGGLLVRLGRLAESLTTGASDPLVGPASLHAALISGGTGMSTYAASATVQIERRTIPGETTDKAVGEIRALLDELSAADPTFHATLAVDLVRDPFKTQPTSPVVRALSEAATSVLGTAPPFVGENPWMDSALLAAAGIDTVIMGPDGAGAHSALEWVDLESVYRTARILAETAQRYCA